MKRTVLLVQLESKMHLKCDWHDSDMKSVINLHSNCRKYENGLSDASCSVFSEWNKELNKILWNFYVCFSTMVVYVRLDSPIGLLLHINTYAWKKIINFSIRHSNLSTLWPGWMLVLKKPKWQTTVVHKMFENGSSGIVIVHCSHYLRNPKNGYRRNGPEADGHRKAGPPESG